MTSGSAILRSTAELSALETAQGGFFSVAVLEIVSVLQKTKKVLPGLEPGLKESESLVITITL